MIASKISPSVYSCLGEIKWKIGLNEVDGLKIINLPKKMVPMKSRFINKSNAIFYTFQISEHPKDKILPKNEIVGDHSIINFMEFAVKCLFLYTSKSRKIL